jgi:hypothetical protein
MAAWFDITHELPPHHHNHQHHTNGHHNHQASHHSSNSSSIAGTHMAPNQRSSMQQQQYGREGLYQQQQRPSGPYSPWPQQPQPRPSGPHSAWPNPAYTTLAQQQQPQQAAAGVVTNPGGVMSHPISNDADVDWAPSSPPDPHRYVECSAELVVEPGAALDHQTRSHRRVGSNADRLACILCFKATSCKVGGRPSGCIALRK